MTEPLPRWLRWMGAFFLAWWAYDIILKSVMYDFASYDWLWFCSAALFLLGAGLLFASPPLLNAFFGMALIFQTIWLVDFALLVFSGTPYARSYFSPQYAFNGTFPLYAYLNTMRHLFMLPFGFLGWFLMRKSHRISVPLGGTFWCAILAGSFFLARPDYNVNCAIQSCMPFLDGLNGPLYSAGYGALNLLVGSTGIWVANLFAGKLGYWRKKYGEKVDRIGWRIFAVLIAIALVLLVRGLRVYFAAQHA